MKATVNTKVSKCQRTVEKHSVKTKTRGVDSFGYCI